MVRNRLLLARLFTRPANVLVLDEPTNDLDIETLELLEVLLRDYSGTLFLVSHDREFLDNVVTQVIAFEGNGLLREYVGGYEDWVRARRSIAKVVEPKAGKIKSGISTLKSSKSATSGKLSYNDARELEALPAKIEALEKEQESITLRLGDSVIYQDFPDEAKELQIRFSAIEKELMAYLVRWDELDAKSSKARKHTK